tara:strand:- start:583 stop:714 length:132 start_codon:yes stop_codon:yes gene_type:complete
MLFDDSMAGSHCPGNLTCFRQDTGHKKRGINPPSSQINYLILK